MRFLGIDKRDPVSALLVAAAVFVTLFICFELFRGLHRYHGNYGAAVVEKIGPAGLLTATLSAGGLELSGWAPPNSPVQILDHDKIMGAMNATEEGKWKVIFPYDKHNRNVQILLGVFQQNGKSADMGRIGILAPSKSYEDAYVWWDGPNMDRLLQAPAELEESDLYLALAWTHGNQDMAFAGRAAPASLIQIYANDEYIGAVPVAADGTWIMSSYLKSDRKNLEIRIDDLQGQEVFARRIYKLDGVDDKEGSMVEWPATDGKKENILVLKQTAGDASPPDEEKPGQVIPIGEPLQNTGISR